MNIKAGPGGHRPDGTGPHGRGNGPGGGQGCGGNGRGYGRGFGRGLGRRFRNFMGR